MSYHDLSECTLSPLERREEATKIIEMLSGMEQSFTTIELRFFERMEDETEPVSVKQLFWLRDIKDKYL